MNNEQVEAFADAAKIKITEGGMKSRCVDGRYEGGEDIPLKAKPGGDAGDLMVVFGALNKLKLSMENSQVLEIVNDSIGGESNFQFHTDEHAENAHDGVGMGCGHLRRSGQEPDAYGVTPEQMSFIMAELPKLLALGAHQEILKGHHAESAVMVVESEYYGLKPLIHTPEGIREAFIYHKTMHEQQMDKLARMVHEKLAAAGVVIESEVISKAMDESFAEQLGATLFRFARGLPVFTVEIDEQGAVAVKQ